MAELTEIIESLSHNPNNSEMFRLLWDKKNKRVHLVSYLYMGDFHLAEDNTIETMNRVWKGIAFIEDYSKGCSWIIKIARNNAILMNNRLHKDTIIDFTDEEQRNRIAQYLYDNAISPERAVELEQGFESLSNIERLILVGILTGYSQVEIAKN